MCYFVLILLRHHCTGENPMQCCPKNSRQHCIIKNSVQCCLSVLGATLNRRNLCAILSGMLQAILHKKNCCPINNLGTTLRRSRPYAMLCERFQETFCKKFRCKIFLILFGQHFTSQNLIQCYLRGSKQLSIRKDPVQ